MNFLKSLKAKLSSRKLWSAVIGVAVALSAMFGLDEMTTGQITALISAIGVLVAYIFAEAQVDSARNTKDPSSKSETTAESTAETARTDTSPEQISLFQVDFTDKE